MTADARMPDALLAAIVTVPDVPTPGVAFRDLTPVLADPALYADALERLAAPWAGGVPGGGITHVVGVEARGFWFGPTLAARLGAGFVPARKPGKLPRAVVTEAYALEYGTDTLALHADAFADVFAGALAGGARVLVHDDVLATGGTAAAACALVVAAGGTLVGVSVVMEIAALGGRARLPAGVRFAAVLTV